MPLLMNYKFNKKILYLFFDGIAQTLFLRSIVISKASTFSLWQIVTKTEARLLYCNLFF